MEKEQFIERRNALNQQLKQLCNEYIETNIKYHDGMMVKVTNSTGKSRFGVVRGNIIVDDIVLPYVMQLTKDGEISRRRIVVNAEDTVEIING